VNSGERLTGDALVTQVTANDAGDNTGNGPYATLLPPMLRAARAADRVIRDGATRRAALVWEAKGPADYVTAVDTGAEAAIYRELSVAYPEAQFLGEEGFRGETAARGLCFVADPLDGTTNFLHGVPEYAVSIAALMDGVPVAAVILHAARGDLYTATQGGGAFLDGVQLHVSHITEPARALIATGFPFNQNSDLSRYVRQFSRVAAQTAGIRRAGAASLDFAGLAAGRYEAFWELTLAPWDIAAGILLIREAGGMVTDLDGGDAIIRHGGFVAGNPVMHRWMLDQLRLADADLHEATPA
jgi:myo-inositol-1(or 4)-monophosphatase